MNKEMKYIVPKWWLDQLYEYAVQCSSMPYGSSERKIKSAEILGWIKGAECFIKNEKLEKELYEL